MSYASEKVEFVFGNHWFEFGMVLACWPNWKWHVFEVRSWNEKQVFERLRECVRMFMCLCMRNIFSSVSSQFNSLLMSCISFSLSFVLSVLFFFFYMHIYISICFSYHSNFTIISWRTNIFCHDINWKLCIEMQNMKLLTFPKELGQELIKFSTFYSFFQFFWLSLLSTLQWKWKKKIEKKRQIDILDNVINTRNTRIHIAICSVIRRNQFPNKIY